ncbi:MAG: protein kinase family protein [Mycoplasmataceae bacterium]|nr:protein kinase family protein [Mycoplasmataceae bacterium]
MKSIISKEHINAVYWLLFKYLRFKKKLSNKYNIDQLKPLKVLAWHQGAYYFTAIYKAQKIFIKTDFLFGLLENEFNIFQTFRTDDFFKSKIIDVVLFSKEDNFIAMNYTEGMSLKSTIENSNAVQVRMIVDGMINIIKELHEYKIVHRDIKLDNFLIVDNNIVIIDFLFAIGIGDHCNLTELSEKVANSVTILKYMNGENKEDDFLWDDMFSLKIIIENIAREKNLNLDEYLTDINNCIGKCYYHYGVG